LATKLSGDTTPVNPALFTYTLREPVGVVGAIIPWNFPMIMVGWKAAPALAAGNTIVLKPAELTPLTAIRIAELALEAGVPPGVFNVLPGKGRIAGEALVKHPGVAKLSFTGSTEIGQHLMRTAADTLKKLTLELGGKSPNIVFADADLDAALKGATLGIFYGKGEVCAAGSRLFVEKPIYDDFVSKLAERAKKLVPADPMDPKTRLGALVIEAQMDKVLGYVETGVKEGAQLVAGGQRQPVNGKGAFVQATVLAGVEQPHARGAGGDLRAGAVGDPVRRRRRRRAQANDVPTGSPPGVDARREEGAHGGAPARRRHRVGEHVQLLRSRHAVRGVKGSGFGRDLGEACLQEYTQVKSRMDEPRVTE
jgi:acyl-CoA reductase-like NAD-dependent aldehyde dehydrogenase